MSIPILLEDLSEDEKIKISEDLTIKENHDLKDEKNKFMKNKNKKFSFYVCEENLKMIEAFDVRKYKKQLCVFLPLNYCYKLYGREIFSKHSPNFGNTSFCGTLTPLQNEVLDESMKLLKKQRSCLISLQCGLGKTFLSLYIANQLKLKTIILIHRIILIEQWIESINKVLPNLKIQVCDSSNSPEPEYDIYIMNMLNVGKIIPSQFEKCGIYTLIIDEVHVCCAEVMSKCLQYICPDYLIGLSATPFRKDGLDKILDVYFGEERLIRKVKRPHNVIKIQTDFEINATVNKQNSLNWNSVISSQANNEERNNFICDILEHYNDKTWIVLCKLVSHVKLIYNLLISRGFNKNEISTLYGNQQTYNSDAKILIASFSKTGIGFDNPKLNAMILASDVVEFEQIHGRIFRKEDTIPLFIDIVDNFQSLKSHWYERKKFYEDAGGTVASYSIKKFRKEILNE